MSGAQQWREARDPGNEEGAWGRGHCGGDVCNVRVEEMGNRNGEGARSAEWHGPGVSDRSCNHLMLWRGTVAAGLACSIGPATRNGYDGCGKRGAALT